MGTDLPKVIWESEHKSGMRYRIVRWVPAGLQSATHALEESTSADAMGARIWVPAPSCDILTETLLQALLRELPK